MNFPYSGLRLIALVLSCTLLPACNLPPGNDQLPLEDEPYIILISIDGLGSTLPAANKTPTLDRIAAEGVRAESLRPVFPTMTFPNHYSIATGLVPAQHGIVDNDFPNRQRSAWYRLSDRSAVQDGQWYHGEPIWVSAEKSGITSATYYFVGSEAAISGVSPTYWRAFDGSIPGEARVRQAIKWLSLPPAQRPHMLALYFEDVDSASHEFGPNSVEASLAVERVDGYLQLLMQSINTMELAEHVTYIIVSDHGQATHRPSSEAFVLDQHIKLEGVEVVDHRSFAALYLDPNNRQRAAQIRDQINAQWNQGRAYLRGEAPAHWRISQDPRFADIYVIPDEGFAVVSTASKLARVAGGDHGWDPSFKAMHGVLYASGPRLPQGLQIGETSNLEVYPLMMDILGLPLPADWEYQNSVLAPLLLDSAIKP